MAHWVREVRSQLRPSEHLRLILVGTVLLNNLPRIRVPKTQREPSVILAVVGHHMSVGRAVEESGSVFIYREPEHEIASVVVHGSLLLQHIFPIHEDFSLEISQHSAPAGPGSSPISELSSTPTDSGFSVRLTEGGNIFTIVTYDMERLSSVALACRGLRDLALKPPRDLRHEYRSLLSRLSQGCAGMPGNDAMDYTTIRDDWLYSKSRSTTCKNAEQKQLSIRAGTFNVNGKLPFQDLSTWFGAMQQFSDTQSDKRRHLTPPSGEPSVGRSSVLPLEEQNDKASTTSEPDLLVVAFQEVDHSTEALFYTTGPAREDAWTAAILAALGEKAEKYEKLASKQLVGILLIVLVKNDLRICFTGARESSVASGIMGVMGNKGAVAIRLTYRPHPTPSAPTPIPIVLTFVNSHLAAFDDQLDRRNADFHDISRRLTFGPCAEYAWGPQTSGTGEGPPMLDIYASDFLLWLIVLNVLRQRAALEDLNYRLDLLDADIRHLLRVEPVTHGISTLLEFDQLRSTTRLAKAFAEFEEHPINFLPTYRFDSALQTDSLGYDTKRKPAWTDRILHMSSSFVPTDQRSYNAHPYITISDHRAVSAEFLIPCVDSMALDSVANNLYKSIESFDSEDPSNIPLLKLDEFSLDFGKVSYVQRLTQSTKSPFFVSYSTPVSRSSCIRNIGNVPAAFRFLPRDLSSPIHPRWLKIETMTGFLLPGEEMNLQFTILVSPAIAAPLNLKIQKLSTLLIVHTIFGQDLFLSLNGEYGAPAAILSSGTSHHTAALLEQTCFGTHLSALARLRGPIRELKGTGDLLPESQARNSSREFMKLMGWLMGHDVETVRDLFITPGDEDLASQMRESLDTGADLPPCPPAKAPHTVDAGYACTVAAVLLAFLDSLPESVVPPSLHQRCCDVTSRDAAFETLSVFPPSSVNVWISVTAFLHLLTLKSGHPAGVTDERPSSPTLEVTRLTDSQSHAETLASVFAPILLRDDIDAPSPVSLLGKKKFLLLFMEGP
ncbi:DNase I-like protein [Lactarius akahatsu]|uniref:DNase I-like protein n=1 Tax=Lactarius akahatsu TaxID=416441 RepID=A0AAD4QE01_9AGAM|nr:DNase I-like protein [Lactarius akahatsu]